MQPGGGVMPHDDASALAEVDRVVATSPAAARFGGVAGAISMPNISERSSLASFGRARSATPSRHLSQAVRGVLVQKARDQRLVADATAWTLIVRWNCPTIVPATRQKPRLKSQRQPSR